MRAKLLNVTSIFSQTTELDQEQDERESDLLSLDSLPEKHQPVEDFRVLVSNLQTIEESMTAKAKTLNQKTQLLHTWEKLKGLICAMTDRLEKDVENARRIEQRLQEAKEQTHMLQLRGGNFSRFN